MAQENTTKQKLDKLLKSSRKAADPRRNVVYGIYDNSGEGLFRRIDDFLIDSQKVPLQEKAYFYHLLAVMIDSGIPLVSSLPILSEKTGSLRLARILNTIAYNLKQGVTLSMAMSRFEDVFSDMEIGVVKSGEAAGSLDKMLFKLAEQIGKSNDLQIKLITAAIYPIAVLVVLVLTAAAMLTFVIPNLIGMLREGGLKESDFPAMTKALILISEVLLGYWWAILGIVFLIYFMLKLWISTETGKYKWDIFKLRIPVIGELIRKVYVLRFVSTMGILLESGLSVVKTLEIIASSLSSETYSLKTWEVLSRVKNGEKISESLMDTPFLFPSIITQMLLVGEQTASIGKISEKISAHYDNEIDHTLKRLMSLFEPVMIVVVGVSVALLALAILTPVFKLTSLVGG